MEMSVNIKKRWIALIAAAAVLVLAAAACGKESNVQDEEEQTVSPTEIVVERTDNSVKFFAGTGDAADENADG